MLILLVRLIAGEYKGKECSTAVVISKSAVCCCYLKLRPFFAYCGSLFLPIHSFTLHPPCLQRAFSQSHDRCLNVTSKNLPYKEGFAALAADFRFRYPQLNAPSPYTLLLIVISQKIIWFTFLLVFSRVHLLLGRVAGEISSCSSLL